jgi:hypothetical protein
MKAASITGLSASNGTRSVILSWNMVTAAFGTASSPRAGHTATRNCMNWVLGHMLNNQLGVLSFLHFHYTYHLGQLETLRQLAGRRDKVI